MADADNQEVKEFTERVEVTPAGDNEELETGETDPDSSPENEGEVVTTPDPEHLETPTPAPAPVSIPTGLTEDDLKEVAGETPRERALRLEVTRLKRSGRESRTAEIVTPTATSQPVTPPNPANEAILSKYRSEEIQSLREVFPLLAQEMGFVRKDELQSSTFAEKASDELNTFLEAHPEYLPENDPNNTLWDSFKNEFNRYKPPTSPKEYREIFNRVHRDVFGIQPAGALPPTVTAAAKKVEAASHAGPTSTPPQPRSRPVAQGAVRTDMLKGFTPEDLKEMGLE